MRAKAENESYGQYLQQQQGAGNVQKTGLENRNLELQTPLQDEAKKVYDKLVTRWQQNDLTPEDFTKFATNEMTMSPAARILTYGENNVLGNVMALPRGKGYQLQMQDDIPTGVTMYGKRYDLNSPDLPPEAKAEVAAAQGAHATKLKETEDKEKRVAGYAADRQAAGFAHSDRQQNEKPPSEGERNAFSFYTRGADADKILRGLESKIAEKGFTGQLGLNYLPNFMQGDDEQIYRQAQRQFTQAKLRRESGAAISQAEYDQDAKTFFPQPGDTKDTLSRKADAREAILNELRVASGKAYTQTFGEIPKPGAFRVPAGAPAAPKEDGHKLKADGKVVAVSKGGQWVAP
jgi:hypothetical protein